VPPTKLQKRSGPQRTLHEARFRALTIEGDAASEHSRCRLKADDRRDNGAEVRAVHLRELTAQRGMGAHALPTSKPATSHEALQLRSGRGHSAEVVARAAGATGEPQ
jgi:hypothetical protein